MVCTETILWLLDEMRCGAAMLDGLGSVLAVNTSAERILKTHRMHGGHSSLTTDDAVAKMLQGLLGKDLTRSVTGIATADGAGPASTRPLVLHKRPLDGLTDKGARAMLVLVDLNERPRPNINILRHTFGLTLAEARLAAQLATGRSLREIAGQQKVTIETIRAQLKSVLAKTHTHRQAELVALANRLTQLSWGGESSTG
jgi:DNA-binding CsgD family transcriptional regulator